MIIPVLGFVYVRIESAILRRSGIPPLPEQIGSLDSSAGERKPRLQAQKAA